MSLTVAQSAGRGKLHKHQLLAVDGVSKSVGDSDNRQQCLDRCSFSIDHGQLNTLAGPSGCGKTTLINLIAGYESPERGSIALDGEPVRQPSSDRLVVFQETALFPWMTVYGNVVFGCKVKGANERETAQRAKDILHKVGLYEFRDRYPAQLSGGMQRRAELARALINDPKLMILDEPFRGLDAMTKELMQEFYLKLFEETRLTTLFVTHDVEEAIFMADQLIVMTNRPGRVREIIDINLPRPRHFSMIASKKFVELQSYALKLLVEEATKSFEAESDLGSESMIGA